MKTHLGAHEQSITRLSDERYTVLYTFTTRRHIHPCIHLFRFCLFGRLRAVGVAVRLADHSAGIELHNESPRNFLRSLALGFTQPFWLTCLLL